MKKSIVRMIILVFAITIPMVGCVGTPDTPLFVDRSRGWELSLGAYIKLSTRTIEDIMYSPKKAEFWNDILLDPVKSKVFPDSGEVTHANIKSRVFEVMKTFFGDSFIDIGTGDIRIYENFKKTVMVAYNENILVALERETGTPIFCVDERIQSSFEIDIDRMKSGSEYYSALYYCNLADMNAEELEQYNIACWGKSLSEQYDTTQLALPLDAQGAYQIVEYMILNRKMGNGYLSGVGGKCYVYYCQKSDAWFVVTNGTVHAFARETGKQLLFRPFGGKGTADLSVEIDN